MQKVLKRIVAWIGIILLGIVIILNLMYNVKLNVSEILEIKDNLVIFNIHNVCIRYIHGYQTLIS